MRIVQQGIPVARANADGKADALVSAHSVYRRLGREEGERQAAYRALVKAPLDAQIIDKIRECTNKGWAPGGERFQSKVERLAELPKGRPRRDGDA